MCKSRNGRNAAKQLLCFFCRGGLLFLELEQRKVLSSVSGAARYDVGHQASIAAYVGMKVAVTASIV